MTDYYVQVRKGGVWHRWSGDDDKPTPCGVWAWDFTEYEHQWDRGKQVWYRKSTEPQQPLCKRCERSKR